MVSYVIINHNLMTNLGTAIQLLLQSSYHKCGDQDHHLLRLHAVSLI